MTQEESYEEEALFLGGGEGYGFRGLDFLVLCWSSAVLQDHYGGHRFVGGFWARGPG
jgi:hypothetical protein